MADLVAGRVPAAALAGKRILIGATAVELGDRYTVAAARAAPRSGRPGAGRRDPARRARRRAPAGGGWALALGLAARRGGPEAAPRRGRVVFAFAAAGAAILLLAAPRNACSASTCPSLRRWPPCSSPAVAGGAGPRRARAAASAA